MSRSKLPTIPNELLDQLLAGGAASAAFKQGGLLHSLKKALTDPPWAQRWIFTSPGKAVLTTREGGYGGRP
jgi:hypothetical protein